MVRVTLNHNNINKTIYQKVNLDAKFILKYFSKYLINIITTNRVMMPVARKMYEIRTHRMVKMSAFELRSKSLMKINILNFNKYVNLHVLQKFKDGYFNRAMKHHSCQRHHHMIFCNLTIR